MARTDGVDLPADRRGDGSPVLVRMGRVERQLGQAVGDGVAIHGDTGAVRAPIAHLRKHRDEVGTEVQLDLGRLREQPDDPAHTLTFL